MINRAGNVYFSLCDLSLSYEMSLRDWRVILKEEQGSYETTSYAMLNLQ